MRATFEQLGIEDDLGRSLRGYSMAQLHEVANACGYDTHVVFFVNDDVPSFTMTFYRKSKLGWLYSAWDSTMDFLIRSW